jgi:hypothetical protein
MITKGLVHIFVPAVEGIDGLKRKVFQIRKNFKISRSSIVYKRFAQAFQRQQIEAVIEIEIEEQTPSSQQISKELASLNATLLILEGQLRVDPAMTIPHPQLVLDSFLLKMSAEIRPYWEHRVSQNTLQGLSSQFPSQDQAEFLTQGSELINFTIKGLV